MTTGVIWVTIDYLTNNNISPAMTLLLGFLLGLLTTIINIVISNLKSASILNSFEGTMTGIFLTAFIITIILTVLLSMRWIPNYFNSIYILLGSIMVAAIGFYLNSRLEKEKEFRKTRRIIYLVNDTIKIYIENAETSISSLETYWGNEINITLKKGFWDIFSSNIVDIDFNPELVRDLVLIKELTFQVNDLIMKRSRVLTLLNRNLPQHAELIDIYDDFELAELTQLTQRLKNELKKLVDLSSNFLSKNEFKSK